MQSDAISASSTQEPETCVFDCVSVDWEELDGDGKESLVEDFVPTPLCLEGPAGEAAVPLPNTADCVVILFVVLFVGRGLSMMSLQLTLYPIWQMVMVVLFVGGACR